MKRDILRLVLMILSLLSLVLFCSCDIQKRAVKQKEQTEKTTDTTNKVDKESKTTTVTERTVEGGNIRTEIIPEKDRERDATGTIKELVQEIKDGGLTKTIYYKPNGSVEVDCRLAEMFERIQQENVERDNSIITIIENLETRLIAKESEKTEKFDSDIILYGFIGLGFLIVIVGGAFLWFMKKQNGVIIASLQKGLS